MWSMIWPIGMVVLANCVYNICAKSAPADADAFIGLFVTYVIAAVCCLILFFAVNRTGAGGFFAELGKINWTYLVLGVVIIALEFGYICVYRAGWQVNTAPLVANISLAVALVVIGALLFGETLTLRKAIGMAVCAAGMILMGK